MSIVLCKLVKVYTKLLTQSHDVFEQVRNDIQNNVSFIESKITQYGLDGYSMYVYLLPFADADEDKKDIMDKLLQSEGGQA